MTGCASLLGVDGQLKYQAVLDTCYQVHEGEFIVQYSIMQFLPVCICVVEHYLFTVL